MHLIIFIPETPPELSFQFQIHFFEAFYLWPVPVTLIILSKKVKIMSSALEYV